MTKHEKTIEQTYQVLSDVDHVLHRPGVYIGSTSNHISEEYVYIDGKMEKKEIQYVPGLIKIFNEVLDNSIDEFKRNGKIDTIRVTVDKETGEISIYDNGGIPVQKHSEFNEYIPEIIFGRLRSGSNYNDADDQQLVGTNGVGAKCAVIFSKYCLVETCDGIKNIKFELTNNMKAKSVPKIKESTNNHTKLTFLPEYHRFGNLTGLDEDHFIKIQTAVVNAAGNNPECKFYFNGERIHIRSFKDYIALYTEEFEYEENDDWKIAVAHSKSESLEQVSFVNSVNTYDGGTHIFYVCDQITNKLRELILKKHKIDITPGNIRNHFRLFISCNVNRPKFDSQTKSRMISEIRDYKTKIEITDKFVKKLFTSPIIQSVLDWIEAKARAQELADMRKLNKNTDKFNLKKIKKFYDATSKDRQESMLFISEGDSASSSILAARNPKTMAAFPLRGRPINVCAAEFAKIKANEEFENIRNIIGLKYNEKADIGNLNFGKIIIASDFDSFGHSICGLIINMFYRLWPEMVETGMIYRLETPIVIVTYKKDTLEFFNEELFEEWRKKHQGERYEYSYLKGLGSSDVKEFKKYLSNLDKYLVQFTYEPIDKEALDLCFLKESGVADRRKEWLSLE